MGWEQFEARRRVVAAEQVGARTSVDGAVLPARLPATGEVFTAGKASLRHVEVIARVLGSRAAARLTPDQWAGVEGQLAAKTDQYSPTELHRWGTALVEMLDQDGEATRRPAAAGGQRAVYHPQPVGQWWADQGAVRRRGDVRGDCRAARREGQAVDRR